jgi:tyrosinase
MTVIRNNVYEVGGDWAEPILWYARGVKAMKARKLNEPTGWRFYGAMHGIFPQLWRQYGYLKSSDRLPTTAVQRKYWKQCQHGSWYFLPWHRGYLIAFEAIIRDAVVKAGGPSTWALPYWNYFKANQNALPPAFGSPNWPDGNGDNPLFVKQRYGDGSGNVFVPIDQVNMTALGDPDFAGDANGGSPGFGGVDTGFSHGGEVHGDLETQPHDWVHGLVGGELSQDEPGLMSDPDTAGLDPIFWLHHANIDRLWEVWRRNPPGTHTDPNNQANWKNGPASTGERAFVMPMPDGSDMTYTPGQMSDLSTLSYTYDDLSPLTAQPLVARRMERLGVPAPAALAAARSAPMAKNVELLGASNPNIRLSGTEARAAVALDSTVQRKVATSLNAARSLAAGPTPTVPDRVFLNLENVRGLSDATAFKVYINLPQGADPMQYPDHLAGNVALFGVRKATRTEDNQAGNGLTFVLDITHVIDALHLANNFDASKLDVRLVPVKPVPEEAQISIGRIGIFRQGD